MRLSPWVNEFAISSLRGRPIRTDSQRCRRTFVRKLASEVAGELGAKVGVAPRLFVKKLVDVLDLIELHPAYDPQRDFARAIADVELTDTERAARGVPATSSSICRPRGARHRPYRERRSRLALPRPP